MKKRLTAVFLALALCLGLAVPAFAAGDTVSVTDAGISFDAISTSKYGNAKDAFDWRTGPENEFLYSVGLITNLEGGFGNFWTYLVNEDVKLDFHLKKGEKFSIDAYYLTESEKSSSGVTTYTPISIANYWISANEDGELVGKELIEEFFPGANYLVCWRGTADEFDPDNAINIVFADENAVPRTVPGFTDLLSWCNKEALWASWRSITNGYGAKDKFAPGVECSQQEILTFLWRAEDKPDAKGKSPFTVASWYQDAVDWAYGEGIIGDDFQADAPCTRAQAVTYIWKALGEKGAGKPAGFPDVAEDASYAAAADWAYEKGVVKSYGGTGDFAPDIVCSRGQIACMLYRAYN